MRDFFTVSRRMESYSTANADKLNMHSNMQKLHFHPTNLFLEFGRAMLREICRSCRFVFIIDNGFILAYDWQLGPNTRYVFFLKQFWRANSGLFQYPPYLKRNTWQTDILPDRRIVIRMDIFFAIQVNGWLWATCDPGAWGCWFRVYVKRNLSPSPSNRTTPIFKALNSGADQVWKRLMFNLWHLV